jgi:hypothetical protein
MMMMVKSQKREKLERKGTRTGRETRRDSKRKGDRLTKEGGLGRVGYNAVTEMKEYW